MAIKSKKGMGGAPVPVLFSVGGESGGIATLPTDLTINSTTVSPTYFYQAKDATTSTWTGTGGTLTGGGSGGTVDLDSPTAHPDDRAVDTSTTRRWDGSGSITLDDDDLVFEAVAQLSSVANGHIACTRSAANGFNFRKNGSGTGFQLYIDGASGGATINGATSLTLGAWYHIIVFIDKSGSAQMYVNGAASGSAVSVTGVGSISDDDSLTLGALSGGAGSLEYDAQIAHFAMWKQSSWLDTHLQADLALERYARVAGLWSTQATIQSDARATAGYLDKISHNDSVRRLHYVGSNWHRLVRRSDGTDTKSGYLSELAGTNNCLHSQTFDNVVWTKTNTSITADSTTAPDGESTADTIVEDTNTGSHSIIQSGVTQTATDHTYSIWAKAANRNWLYLQVATTGDPTMFGNFDLSTGSVGTTGGIDSSGIEDWGNGWYRCWITDTRGTANNATLYVFVGEADNDVSFTGLNQDSIYVWGAQWEASAAPSSYIPTTSGTVTRNKDELRYDTSSISLTQGTIACDVLLPDYDDPASVFYSWDDGTSSERIQGGTTAADVFRGKVTDGGSDQAQIDGSTDLSDGTWRETRVTWAANDFHVYIDKTEEGTPDTSGTVPTVDELNVGQNVSAAFQPNGVVANIRILKKPTLKG